MLRDTSLPRVVTCYHVLLQQQRELGVHAVGVDSLDPCLEAVPKKAEMVVQLVVVKPVLGDETKESVNIKTCLRRTKV